MDLAKLALVTSRDEEDEEADKGGTDSSNDTDATLVEDPPSRTANNDSFNSVLGKRYREEQGGSISMDVDEGSPKTPASDIEHNGYVMVSHPPSPRRSKSPRVASPSSSNTLDTAPDSMEKSTTVQPVEDTSKKPPLPARKPTINSESVMLFGKPRSVLTDLQLLILCVIGKQHDVAECMDNCMFQIEIALLKFDGLNDAEEKGSIVKRLHFSNIVLLKHDHLTHECRLFYGKLGQRITTLPDQRRSRSSIHEKQDLFSHLPVNVTTSGVDIYDGLSGYFDDTVEFEGSKARMEVSLVELPPLLQIQLQVSTVIDRARQFGDCIQASAIQPRNAATLQITSIRQVWGDHLHGSVP